MASYTVLIFGNNGQVARELGRAPWHENNRIVQVGRDDLDLLNATRKSIEDIIGAHTPSIVINATAYTAVDQAESEQSAANALNRDAPGFMAEACATYDIPFIHISTDYVFDGEKTSPYEESDPIAPQSVYGQSKADGETAVRDTHAKHIIIRTAWVYSAHGHNFIKTMLRLGAERDELSVVHDQRGCPTSAAEIARTIAAVTHQILTGTNDAFGTYHYGGSQAMTWYEFARAIFEESTKMGAKPPKMLWPISTKEYPTPAKRPQNSELNRAKIMQTFNLTPSSFRDELRACLAELLETPKS